jgi:hypothetical protein
MACLIQTLDEPPQKPRRNSWSARHGLDDKFVFLYSGTLAMKHNPDILWQLALRYRKIILVCGALSFRKAPARKS